VRIAVDRSALADKLAQCARVASARPSVRVLGGVRLVADDGRLALAATDLELAVTTSLAANVEEPGTVVVPARTLLAIVQALDGEVAKLSGDGTVLDIRAGDSSYRLNTLPAEDFPQLPAVRGATRFELPAQVLTEAVGRVLRAASTDLSRPVYTGVRVTVDGRQLTLTATDGYRLATAKAELAQPIAAFDVLVPARALSELIRLAAGAGDIVVDLGENLVRFELPGCEVVARTLDGRPQDHERILSAAFAHRAGVPRAPLLRAVDRAALLAERGSAVELSFREDEIRVRARSADLGEAEERVMLGEKGPNLRIGFNSRYLRDGLELVRGDDVWFEMNDGLGAVVLRGAADDFAYLVAPLRLRD